MVPLMLAGHLTNVTRGWACKPAYAPCDSVFAPGKPWKGMHMWEWFYQESRLKCWQVVKVSRLSIRAAPSCPELSRGERGVRTDTFCSSVKERHAQVIPVTPLGCSPGMHYSGSQKHLQPEDMLEFMCKTYLSGFLFVHVPRAIIFSLGCTIESSGEIWNNPSGQPHPKQLYQNLRGWVPGR